MKLYFGNMVTTVTTLMILSLVGFVGYSISNRGDINFWGRRSLFVPASQNLRKIWFFYTTIARGTLLFLPSRL